MLTELQTDLTNGELNGNAYMTSGRLSRIEPDAQPVMQILQV